MKNFRKVSHRTPLRRSSSSIPTGNWFKGAGDSLIPFSKSDLATRMPSKNPAVSNSKFGPAVPARSWFKDFLDYIPRSLPTISNRNSLAEKKIIFSEIPDRCGQKPSDCL
ncbi:hypothetical protein AYI68_g3064 [Smittium mucronatum]|uniref:Uncharacterized protein n=1 Tax=Smittium mucronatum TaxID=133383 RepID=A0A1R0H109_9FUNG|nr:hypothetical protein AYI68_g3064 [Smittium mucronatum]